MAPTLCEQVAAPLLKLHRKTTSPAMVGVLGLAGLCLLGYGFWSVNHHAAWFGVLVMVTAWYGFLLSGCERLLAAKERELAANEQELVATRLTTENYVENALPN